MEYVAENFTQPIQRTAGKSSGVAISHALGLLWPVAGGDLGVNYGVNDQTSVTGFESFQ